MPQADATNPYLWTKEVTTYPNNREEVKYSVSHFGADAKVITTITPLYKLTAIAPSQITAIA